MVRNASEQRQDRIATRLNRGEEDGPVEYRYGYLLVVAQRRA